MTNTSEQVGYLYCNDCKRTTNHRLVAEHGHLEHSDTWGSPVEYRDKFWICAGCESGTLETNSGLEGSIYVYDDVGDRLWHQAFFPKRGHDDLREKMFLHLKPKLTRIYRETVKSFNDGSLLLCAAGLRSLLEGICDDKKISGGI